MGVTTLLVVETGGEIQQLLQRQFPAMPMTIEAVRTIDTLLDKFHQTPYDLVIWDLQTAPTHAHHGLELLEVLAVDAPRTPVLVVTGREHLRLAIDSLRTGAFHYLRRPLDGEELCELVRVALQQPSARRATTRLPVERHAAAQFDDLIGSSAPMQGVYERIQTAAATDVTVLIAGETGTGKDLVAASIHRRSRRKDGPYLPVNTGAMVPELIASELFGYEKGAFTGATATKPGQFEQAHGGTIFLDEINTMDAKAQVSLLRLLDTQTLRRLGGRKAIKVDVRLIAATNEDLEEAMVRGTFRQDLYYRFDVFRIVLPPLRERGGDVRLLLQTFLSRFNALYTKRVTEFAPEAVQLLERYTWPGNVRELKNVIQRAVLIARGEVLTAELLPDRLRGIAATRTDTQSSPIRPGMRLCEAERELIVLTLAATGGNKQEAAKQLGISRRALYNKLSRHNLAS
jgi:DNA-binding NtrC family response regulator